MLKNTNGTSKRRLRRSVRVVEIVTYLSAATLAFGFSAMAAQSEESPNAGDAAQANPDFSGYWIRPEPAVGAAMFYPPDSGPGPVSYAPDLGALRRGMPMIGDDTNPILQPHAIDALRAQRALYDTDDIVWSAWALCWPAGVPLAFNMIEPVQFLQTEDQVTILYQRAQTVRHVELDQAHPRDPKQSWFGHSVGHYEGADALVIDTIAQDPRTALDRFGTPKSEAMRIVERYVLSADGQSLNVDFMVEDPKTFTTAWSAKFRYARISGSNADGPQEPPFAEIICSENNRDPEGGDFAIPIAATPDF